jgi:ABC-type dipeptide/oligopeptide/nickel transport system ATPase component
MTSGALLEVADLRVDFPGGREQVVKGISFTLPRGECLALIGESGCGKSVTLRTIAGLTGPGAVVRAARLAFAGADMCKFSPADWRRVRGARLGFILQDAMGSLDPLRRVGDEIDEPLRLHQRLTQTARQHCGRPNIPTNYPAACASAPSSPPPLPAPRICYWRTSRPPRWMPWFRPRCWICSPACARATAPC